VAAADSGCWLLRRSNLLVPTERVDVELVRFQRSPIDCSADSVVKPCDLVGVSRGLVALRSGALGWAAVGWWERGSCAEVSRDRSGAELEAIPWLQRGGPELRIALFERDDVDSGLGGDRTEGLPGSYGPEAGA
jgi:hypothetical protein